MNLAAGLEEIHHHKLHSLRVLVVTRRLSEKLHPLHRRHKREERGRHSCRTTLRRRRCGGSDAVLPILPLPTRIFRFARRPTAPAPVVMQFRLEKGGRCQEREERRAIKCPTGMGWAPRDPER